MADKDLAFNTLPIPTIILKRASSIDRHRGGVAQTTNIATVTDLQFAGINRGGTRVRIVGHNHRAHGAVFDHITGSGDRCIQANGACGIGTTRAVKCQRA